MKATDEVAVLDACTLYPANLSDLLLHLAYYRFYTPRWTREILDERERALRRRRRDLTEAQITSATVRMNEVFGDALVETDHLLLRGLNLPDKNDVHVLAGAISCNASTIVTFNLKDFPERVLTKYGVRPEHPDRFCVRLLRKDIDLGRIVFLKQVSSLKRPPKSAVEILDSLTSLGMHETVRLFKSLLK